MNPYIAAMRSDRVFEVADALGLRIVAGQARPGSALPTEPEIQEMFGVSRTVVREATRLLAAKGLVVTRPRLGTKVRSRDVWSMLDADVIRWSLRTENNDDFIRSLYEFRYVIEPHAAMLAAERATERQRTALTAALEGMSARDNHLDVRVAADLEFHRIILAATGNRIMQSLGDLVARSLDIAFSISWTAARLENAMGLHRSVRDAIVAGKPDDAFFTMRKLISGARDDVLDGLLRARMESEDAARAPD